MAGTPLLQLPGGSLVQSYDANNALLSSSDGARSQSFARQLLPAPYQSAINDHEAQQQAAAPLIGQPPVDIGNSASAAAGVIGGAADAAAGAVKSFVTAPPESFYPNAPGAQSAATAVPPIAPAAQVPAQSAPQSQGGADDEPQQDGGAPNDVERNRELVRLMEAQPQTMRVGGGTSTSKTVQGLSDDGKKRVDEGLAALSATEKDQEQAQGAISKEEERAYADQAKLNEADAALIQGRVDQGAADELAHQQRMASETAKLDTLQKQADTEIDPGRWWKNADTGTKILAGIGAALGGFANGYTQGRMGNPALDAITHAVELDVNAQLANRRGKQEAASAKKDLIGLISQQYETDQQRKNALMMLGLNKTAKQIEGISANLQSTTAQANGQKAALGLRQQAQQIATNMAMQAADTKSVHTAQTPGGVVLTQNAMQAKFLKDATDTPYDPEKLIPLSEEVIGVPLQATRKEDASDINKVMTSTRGILRKADSLIALYTNGKTAGPTNRAIVKGVRSSLMTDLAVAKQLGAISGGDSELIERDMGPNGLDITNLADAQRVVRAFKQRYQALVRDNLSARTVPINPDDVPLSARSAFRSTGARASSRAPKTQPLDGGS